MRLSSSVAAIDRLKGAAVALGLTITSDQSDKLLRYVSELQRWNKTYNLTAIRSADEMLVQHIFDSLSVVAPVQKFFATTSNEVKKLMDVGSGAGLPGVVIAIMLPTIRVECVDTVEKKASFIRQMAGVLMLPNLISTHARVEDKSEAGCDLVISRAFASLEDFITVAGRHVVESGSMVAMKGKEPIQEMQSVRNNTDWWISNVEQLTVPEMDAQRCLVWMQRKQAA